MTLDEIDAAIAALEAAQARPLRELKLNESRAPIDDGARRLVIAAYDRLTALDRQISALRVDRSAEVQRLAEVSASESLSAMSSTQLSSLTPGHGVYL